MKKNVQGSPEVVQSPCVGVCVLDDDDICIGCLRTSDEICRWVDLDDKGKLAVLKKVELRSKQVKG